MALLSDQWEPNLGNFNRFIPWESTSDWNSCWILEVRKGNAQRIALGLIIVLLKLMILIPTCTDVVWLLPKVILLITLFIFSQSCKAKPPIILCLFSTVAWMMGHDSFQDLCSLKKKKKTLNNYINRVYLCVFQGGKIWCQEWIKFSIYLRFRSHFTLKKQLNIIQRWIVTHQICWTILCLNLVTLSEKREPSRGYCCHM